MPIANMTPEQLRMLTDFMASVGSAIGGRGSVGEQVGSAVQNINKEQAAIRAQEATETRAEQRKTTGAINAAKALGLYDTGESPTKAKDTFGVLKSDAGPEPSASQLGPLKESGSVAAKAFGLTPDGTPGTTSLSMDKNGNTIIKGMYTPETIQGMSATDVIQNYYAKQNMDTAGMRSELAALQIQAAKEALPIEGEKRLRELQAELGMDQSQLVDVNGVQVPKPVLDKIIMENMLPTALMKNVQAATDPRLPEDQRRLLEEGLRANPYVDPYTRAYEAGTGSAEAKRMNDLVSADYIPNMRKTLESDMEYSINYARMASPNAAPEIKAEARRKVRAMENQYMYRDISGLYPSSKGYTIDAHPDKSGQIWFVVKDKNGKSIDKYVTTSTVEDYQ